MALAVAATFALCTTIILGTYWMFVVRAEGKAADAFRRRLESTSTDKSTRTELTKKDAPMSAVKALDAALARSGRLADPLKRTVTDSGLAVSVGVVVLACVFVATVVFLVFRVIVPVAWVAPLIALLAAPLPYSYVRFVASRRLQTIEEQLPQAVDMIAVSLRAGHAFTTGLLMVAEELPKPLGAEFRLLYDQQNYGKPITDCLRELADRVPLLDARIFVTAVLTQRETGGNLAEVLDKLAGVIRARFLVRRQVRALSAHGRITGLVLGVLPAVLAVILYIATPSHMMTMFEDPLGQKLIAAAAVLEIVGALSIRRIVHIEF